MLCIFIAPPWREITISKEWGESEEGTGILCSFRKYSYLPHGEGFEFPRSAEGLMRIYCVVPENTCIHTSTGSGISKAEESEEDTR